MSEHDSLTECRSKDNREGACVTGKVRYADAEQAAIALDRVRIARAAKPDGKPPERIFYECGECQGFHLSSRPPKMEFESLFKRDDEAWEAYARRLERRIQEQRDQLESINALRADSANRAERKRIEGLTGALGRQTERLHVAREGIRGLVATVKRHEALLAVYGSLEESVRHAMESPNFRSSHWDELAHRLAALDQERERGRTS